jgi:hypothetical protein
MCCCNRSGPLPARCPKHRFSPVPVSVLEDFTLIVEGEILRVSAKGKSVPGSEVASLICDWCQKI